MADNKVNLLVTLKDQASKGVSGLTNKFGSFGKMLNPVTLGIAAAAAALTKLAFSAAKAGDDFAKTATQIGTTADVLSELAFAANIGGAEVGDVATSLRILSKRVNDANNGLLTSVRAFEDAGIATKDANGQFLSAEELLMNSADAFAQMDNATQRTALAMELFGRSGGKLVPILIQGSDAIRDLRQEAKDLGITFSQVEAQQAEAFTDSFLRLTSVFKGIGIEIGKSLIPTFTRLFDVLYAVLLPVAKAIRNIFKLIGIALDGVAQGITFLIEKFDELLTFVDENIVSFDRLARIFDFTMDMVNAIIFPFDLFTEALKRNTDEANNNSDANEKSATTFGVMLENLNKGLSESLQKFSEVSTIAMDVGRMMGSTVGTAIDDIGVAFADSVMEGKSFKDSLKSIMTETAKMLIRQIAIMIARLIALKVALAAVGLSSVAGLAGGGGGIPGIGGGDTIGGLIKSAKGIGKKIGKIGGGFFADGGRPPVNQVSVVGERGAELFVPDRPGTIVPNEMLGGQSIGVVNILPNANLDEALLAKPMSYWLALTQEKLLPALNNLGKSGQTTTLNFRRSR